MTGAPPTTRRTSLPTCACAGEVTEREREGVALTAPRPLLPAVDRDADRLREGTGSGLSSDIRDGDGRLPRYLTVREFAEVTRISRATVYRLIRSGAVPVTRFGRRLVVPRDIVIDGVVVDAEPPLKGVAWRGR